MLITVKEQNGNTLQFLVEREKGLYNNINEPITLTEIDGLTEDEIKTLGWFRLKPLAKRVFEAIEPLDEDDTPIGFEFVPSRTVRTEVYAPEVVYVNSEASVTKQLIDQYGSSTNEYIPIDTSVIGTVTVEGKTINVIEIPKPEPTSDDYMLELDYILSKLEMGV